jgi:hypothetical protein
MKTPLNKILRIVATIALPSVAAVTSASAQTQPLNQIAIQLGAIQLGYVTNGQAFNVPTNATGPAATNLARALYQGQQALKATLSNSYASYVYTTNAQTGNAPVAQSSAFRAQLYTATLNALSVPQTYTSGISKVPVTSYNPKTGKITTNQVTILGITPTKTTASAILSAATARIPDLAPGLVSNAVSAAAAFTTNSGGVVLPIFGPQPTTAAINSAISNGTVPKLNQTTAAKQLANADLAAKTALTATVKAYAAGTKQWAAFPKTGSTATNAYLPNFSTKALAPTSVNPQKPNLLGLADAAAAVAANAINGLGVGDNTNTATNTIGGLYGKTAINVQNIAKSLTQAANAVQKTSTTTVSGVQNYTSGALGAESLGLVTQVAGVANSNWGTPGSPGITAILTGIVKGAVAGVGATSPNVLAVLSGVSTGFYADYLATVGSTTNTVLSLAAFTTANAANIAQTFINAGVKKYNAATLTGDVQSAFQVLDTLASTGGAVRTNPATWNYGSNAVAGLLGVNFGTNSAIKPYLNGVGTPVTDTIGLK